jgi:hypothetical protein
MVSHLITREHLADSDHTLHRNPCSSPRILYAIYRAALKLSKPNKLTAFVL